MIIFDGVTDAAKKVFNVKRWISFEQLARSSFTVKDLAKASLGEKVDPAIQRQLKHMSFEEIMQFYQLSEQDIITRQQLHRKNGWMFMAFTLLPWAYAYIQYQWHNPLGIIMCVLSGILTFSYGLRERLYAERLKKRALKYSFKDMFRNMFKRSAK